MRANTALPSYKGVVPPIVSAVEPTSANRQCLSAVPSWAPGRSAPKRFVARFQASLELTKEGHHAQVQTKRSPMLISGCVGPRGDGYSPGDLMTVDEARSYHAEQIGVLAHFDCTATACLARTPVVALGVQ